MVLSEKPTQNRATFGASPSETGKEMEELKTKLDTLTSVPKKKYPFPMTANQEIGWDNDDVSTAQQLENNLNDYFRTLTPSSLSMLTTREHAQRPNTPQTMSP